METKNAIITSADIKIEGGFLTAWLLLEYDSAGQGFGGHILYCGNCDNVFRSCAGHFVYRVLQIAGVDSWRKLKGKTIRVVCDYDHIDAIGHIINDDWFYPKKDFKRKDQNE